MTAEKSEANCPTCARPLPAPGAKCPHCTSTLVIWSRSRTVFLSICGLLLIPLFTVTGVFVRMFHDKQARIADDWRRAGQVNLAAARSNVAVEDFRNALLYSPDSTQLQLELAEALAQQGRLDEAQNYLLNLRSGDPENSLINLQLAHIASTHGDALAATSYFHDAMYGHWPDDPHSHQLATRKELIEFFLSHNRRDSARAESLSMAAENPADPEIRAQAADFLLQAGDAQSSLSEYERVLRMEPGNAQALVGSGKAALALGRFALATQDFTLAIQKGSKDPETARNKNVASAAENLNPYDTRLNDRDRQKRILRLFSLAEERATSCLPGVLPSPNAATPDQLKPLAAQRAALPKDLNARELATHLEIEKPVLDWVFAVESEAASRCGVGTPENAAIGLIGATRKET